MVVTEPLSMSELLVSALQSPKSSLGPAMSLPSPHSLLHSTGSPLSGACGPSSPLPWARGNGWPGCGSSGQAGGGLEAAVPDRAWGTAAGAPSEQELGGGGSSRG